MEPHISAFDDLGGQAESYQEALARSNAALRPNAAALTEQQIAEREVEARDRMRRHDLHFSAEFIGGGEQNLVSRSLAKQLGSYFGDGSDTSGDDE
jgi:hypothetical protein